MVVPYLTLMREEATQRDYPLRELFNGLRYVVRYGIAWRAMQNDLPAWSAVYQQTQRWLPAGCFETLAYDLQAALRLASGRARSDSGSHSNAAVDAGERRAGGLWWPQTQALLQGPMAVDALGHLVALHVTPADVGDREEVGRLSEAIQDVTGKNVKLAYVDQGYSFDA